MDKITPDALTTFLWVAAALVGFVLAVWALADKIKKSSEWRQSITEKLDKDKKRIDSLEDGNKVICRGILALLSHEINGNSADKLKDAKDELTNYLIER